MFEGTDLHRTSNEINSICEILAQTCVTQTWMTEPEAKRPRTEKSEQLPSWVTLEPGIWESIFKLLKNAEDKKNARLVCRTFKASASRTISHLELKNDAADDTELSELAVIHLMKIIVPSHLLAQTC